MTTAGNGLPTRRTCGAMDVHRKLLTESESYRRARDEVENFTLDPGSRVDPNAIEPRSVEVVVHVVSVAGAPEVTDAQVQSQIEVLNQDYGATNTDLSSVPAPFQPLIGKAAVQFALATSDPTGAPSSGITRTTTTVVEFATDDKVKSAVSGGIDPWPTDRYLNLWVCQLGGGLLGYAQFPGGPAKTDGVVILRTAFGTSGTAAAPFDKGRTATHEVGHYFNLFHIWGDDGTGCNGSDEVDDTPNQAGSNAGIPTFPHVTCGNGPNGDLFMDFMDYTDDAGMSMFTKGQVARMAACLSGARKSLWNSKVGASASHG